MLVLQRNIVLLNESFENMLVDKLFFPFEKL